MGNYSLCEKIKLNKTTEWMNSWHWQSQTLTTEQNQISKYWKGYNN